MTTTQLPKKVKEALFKLQKAGLITVESYRYEHRKYFRCIDFRSKYKDNTWNIKALTQYEGQVYIICPYCNQIHLHGDTEGHRLSHCIDQDKVNMISGYKPKKNVGYKIEL